MLEEGDFVYQLDQELFLVVSEVKEDSYVFAVHGWREIDKERLERYVDGENMYMQSEVEGVVEDSATDEMQERFKDLQEKIFNVYTENELSDEGPQKDFTLKDTDE